GAGRGRAGGQATGELWSGVRAIGGVADIPCKPGGQPGGKALSDREDRCAAGREQDHPQLPVRDRGSPAHAIDSRNYYGVAAGAGIKVLESGVLGWRVKGEVVGGTTEQAWQTSRQTKSAKFCASRLRITSRPLRWTKWARLSASATALRAYTGSKK